MSVCLCNYNVPWLLKLKPPDRPEPRWLLRRESIRRRERSRRPPISWRSHPPRCSSDTSRPSTQSPLRRTPRLFSLCPLSSSPTSCVRKSRCWSGGRWQRRSDVIACCRPKWWWWSDDDDDDEVCRRKNMMRGEGYVIDNFMSCLLAWRRQGRERSVLLCKAEKTERKPWHRYGFQWNGMKSWQNKWSGILNQQQIKRSGDWYYKQNAPMYSYGFFVSAVPFCWIF